MGIESFWGFSSSHFPNKEPSGDVSELEQGMLVRAFHSVLAVPGFLVVFGNLRGKSSKIWKAEGSK